MELGEPVRRPVAVTVAAWLLIVPPIVGAIITIGISLLVSFSFGLGTGSAAALPALLMTVVVVGAFTSLFVLTGYNLLRLRFWALVVAIIIQTLTVAVSGLVVIASREMTPAAILSSVVLPSITLVLLLLPSSIRAFRDAREELI